MTITITTWPTLRSPTGTRHVGTWADLAAWLAMPGAADTAEGWSPIESAGDRRKADAVERIHAIVLDVDAGDVPIERIRAAVDGLRAVVHPTRSSTPEHPRWRVVVAAERPMAPAEHAATWAALRDRMAAYGVAIDEVTRDPARLWFAPRPPAEGEYIAEVLEGEPQPVGQAKPSAYARAALRGEVTRVRDARNGGRNASLNRAAYSLGQLVGADELDPDDVRGELAEAASSAGLPHDEIARTLESGLAAGQRVPRVRVSSAVDDERDALRAELAGERGKIAPTLANVLSILTRDPEWRDVIAWDAFAEAPIIRREPPQRAHDRVAREAGSEWSEADVTRCAAWIATVYGARVGSATVAEAALAAAERHVVHPVREYLAGLKWDGEMRVDTMLVRLAGASDTPASRATARILVVSSVARVMRPGCKADCIPILEGRQGAKKSSLLRALYTARWHSDSPVAMGDKDAYQAMRGVWCLELAELEGMRGRDATRIKAFASSAVDYYRPSYARRARAVPRQTVVVGTTNDDQYLEDVTGARRFLPVRITAIDLDAVERERDQLWAEALHRYRAGESWWPEGTDAHALAREADARYVGDTWTEPVIRWLARQSASDGVLMCEVLAAALGVEIGRQTKREERRVADILRAAGWTRGPLRREGAIRVRRWSPVPAGDGTGDTEES